MELRMPYRIAWLLWIKFLFVFTFELDAAQGYIGTVVSNRRFHNRRCSSPHLITFVHGKTRRRKLYVFDENQQSSDPSPEQQSYWSTNDRRSDAMNSTFPIQLENGTFLAISDRNGSLKNHRNGASLWSTTASVVMNAIKANGSLRKGIGKVLHKSNAEEVVENDGSANIVNTNDVMQLNGELRNGELKQVNGVKEGSGNINGWSNGKCEPTTNATDTPELAGSLLSNSFFCKSRTRGEEVFASVAYLAEMMSQDWTSDVMDTLESDSTIEIEAAETRRNGEDCSNHRININSDKGGKEATTLDGTSVLSSDNLKEIHGFWDRLRPTLSYLGSRERVAKVYKALFVAYTAHNGQRRKSGEPFILHPVEVAILLSGLKMDACTVCAGLLHDTVEDTDLTFEQVETLFGFTVRSIVEGETKVSKLPKQLALDGEDGQLAKNEHEQHKQADEQAENLRQMFVAMTDDYRIIIVKLADRLHNMRTLQHMKPHKQVKISRETLDIFAPLAHRMGIWQFKSELEDIAFMYLYPTEYKRLHRRLQQHAEKFKQTLESSKELLQRRLEDDPTLQQQAATVQVMGRTKEIYSLWHKMETKNIRNLDNVFDVVALRVIIAPKANAGDENDSDRGVWLCYHVLGLVQHLHGFQPVPTAVKDYISFPKPNGYQSLHTALILNGQTIEVQIRTSMMHQVAEYGMASHWAYKEGKRRTLSNENDLYNTPWLSSIKEWQNDRISSRDFVDSVRRELLGKRVFVFLRNGKILNLARGATAIDAAFQIHTEVGLRMHGVEINGRPVPFSYRLKNGDVVSILTGDGKPATEWMRYAKSRSTRSKLRAYFRAQQRDSLLESGRVLLQDYLVRFGPLIQASSYLPYKIPVPVPGSVSFDKDLEKLLPNAKTSFDDVDDLLVSIGKQQDRVMLRTVVSQLFGVSKRLLSAAEDNVRPDDLQVDNLGLRRKQEDETNPSWQRSPLEEYGYTGSLNGNSVKKVPSEQPPLPDVFIPYNSYDNFFSNVDAKFEYADPEHLCQDCLPVHGDAIVGTKFCPKEDAFSGDTSATVHRVGCPHAQRVFNQAWAERRGTPAAPTNTVVDSVRLRSDKWQRLFRAKSRNAISDRIFADNAEEVPVRLEWFDLDDNHETNMCDFLAEIVVHAVDRKLLLADCSVIVSDLSEIVKTGSLTQGEHATLVFLVKVDSIGHIQALMDGLGHVPSVMSVERRFGSELL